MSPFITIFIIAVSVSLDAFAVSIIGGVKARRSSWHDALKVGLFFGGFQAVMPLIGWLMGATLRSNVESVSGWIAFILLAVIGLKMIIDALKKEDNSSKQKNLLNTKTLLLMSIATSIDALVVGVSLSLIGLPLLVSVLIIGITTFAFSVVGFRFGESLGKLFSNKIELVGGLALICIGINLLVT
jgi:putative Mn2+ efflux pump MntP